MRDRRAIGGAAAGLLLVTVLAPGVVMATRGPARPARTPAPDAVGSAGWKDFDGDGHADLAIGIPGEDVGGKANAGAVLVLYGRSSGLSSARSQRWTQASPNVADGPEAGDRFGAALAQADFNADGFGDLAIGVPGEDVGGDVDAGAVNIIYGSAHGLRAKAAQHLLFLGDDPDRPGSRYGSALAALDILSSSDIPFAPPTSSARARERTVVLHGRSVRPAASDGRADLAVGAPGHDQARGLVKVESYGRVAPDPGPSLGAILTPSIDIGARAGAALAAGDFDANVLDDLAIGAPGMDTPAASAVTGGSPAGSSTSEGGEVFVMMGGSIGAYEHYYRGQYLPGPANAADHLGAALAVGRFGTSGHDDLAIGAPNADVVPPTGPVVPDAGIVFILYAEADGSGLSKDGDVDGRREGAAAVPGPPRAGDHFGTSLAAAQMGKGSGPDLAVGIPGRDVGGKRDAGAVAVLYQPGIGGPNGVEPDQRLSQATAGIAGKPGKGDHFGASLWAANIDGKGKADLAIGVPNEDVGGKHDAGWVDVLYSTASAGLIPGGSQTWSENSPGVAGSAGNGDHFGAELP